MPAIAAAPFEDCGPILADLTGAFDAPTLTFATACQKDEKIRSMPIPFRTLASEHPVLFQALSTRAWTDGTEFSVSGKYAPAFYIPFVA